MQGRTGKPGPEKFPERLRPLRRFQQTRTPLRETGSDLVMIFFRDEIVEARRDFEQRGVQRPLHPIVRMHTEFCIRWAAREERCNRQTVEVRWKQGCAGSLAAPDKKFTTLPVDQVNRLLWPAQGNAPWLSRWITVIVELESSIRISVQVVADVREGDVASPFRSLS
jgi:hypothetical protein